jgi:hypothetical protein
MKESITLDDVIIGLFSATMILLYVAIGLWECAERAIKAYRRVARRRAYRRQHEQRLGERWRVFERKEFRRDR